MSAMERHLREALISERNRVRALQDLVVILKGELQRTQDEHAACLRVNEYLPSPYPSGWGGDE